MQHITIGDQIDLYSDLFKKAGHYTKKALRAQAAQEHYRWEQICVRIEEIDTTESETKEE